MVRTGGHVIMHVAGNNWFGRGFCQFSPELFFRVFSEENGFAVEAMSLVENFPPGRWYSMVDPARVGRRAETYSALPILIMVEAVKQREVPSLLESPPRQHLKLAYLLARIANALPLTNDDGAKSKIVARRPDGPHVIGWLNELT